MLLLQENILGNYLVLEPSRMDAFRHILEQVLKEKQDNDLNISLSWNPAYILQNHYHIYDKYWNILTRYQTYPKMRTKLFYNSYCVWVATSVDSDQTPQNAASDLGLHCLLRPLPQ